MRNIVTKMKISLIGVKFIYSKTSLMRKKLNILVHGKIGKKNLSKIPFMTRNKCFIDLLDHLCIETKIKLTALNKIFRELQQQISQKNSFLLLKVLFYNFTDVVCGD